MTTATDYKQMAKRLRTALANDGVTIGHSWALELVAAQFGARDWNTLAARQNGTVDAPFSVGQPVEGTFNDKPAQGRVIGLSETIKPDLWRVTVKFDPPVDVVTSELFSSERRRITMIVGADGRSRRLTGTETGVMALKAA
ncbi:MAG: glyoxalase superfamily protein [Rhizobiaceae bacterium]